jgi:2-polyprenyl-3-methyl-5-hydroxy-6-metoxy-1,4-benzoquinol methylase
VAPAACWKESNSSWTFASVRVCHLRFRYPKDDVVENKDAYQHDYQQTTVTDLPPVASLEQHKSENFARIGRDLTEHLELMRPSEGSRILDYGASWGYCTWQFRQRGYDAVGFEISRPRAEYGAEHLGVQIATSTELMGDSSFDVIYTAHVLEHVPNPRKAFEEMYRLLAPGGVLFLFVPNGACEPARRLGVGYSPLINQWHLMAYTPSFFDFSLRQQGFDPMFTSSPYSTPPKRLRAGDLFDGEELCAIATCRK